MSPSHLLSTLSATWRNNWTEKRRREESFKNRLKRWRKLTRKSVLSSAWANLTSKIDKDSHSYRLLIIMPYSKIAQIVFIYLLTI
jgi:hypothetical protein